jgi:hypothetical protein
LRGKAWDSEKAAIPMTALEAKSMGLLKSRDSPCLFSRQKAWGLNKREIPHDHSGMGICILLDFP